MDGKKYVNIQIINSAGKYMFVKIINFTRTLTFRLVSDMLITELVNKQLTMDFPAIMYERNMDSRRTAVYFPTITLIGLRTSSYFRTAFIVSYEHI